MKTKEKDFDSVKMMRSIRDKISFEIADMNKEQIKEYIKKRKQKFDKIYSNR